MNSSDQKNLDTIECYNICRKNTAEVAEQYFSSPTFIANFGKTMKIYVCSMQNPSTSTLQVEVKVVVSQSTEVRVSKKNKFHPYKFLVSRTLNAGDRNSGLEFCMV